jgi:hypothetical protein
MASFNGSITTTGTSEAIRLDEALFRLHPEFREKAKVAAPGWDVSIRNLINRHISQLTLLQIGTEVIAMSDYQYTVLYMSPIRLRSDLGLLSRTLR